MAGAARVSGVGPVTLDVDSLAPQRNGLGAVFGAPSPGNPDLLDENQLLDQPLFDDRDHDGVTVAAYRRRLIDHASDRYALDIGLFELEVLVEEDLLLLDTLFHSHTPHGATLSTHRHALAGKRYTDLLAGTVSRMSLPLDHIELIEPAVEPR